MMKIGFLFCWIVLCQATENVHNKMYVQLVETMPCILRLNGSQSFGCTSKRGGSVGVIHLAYNESALSWLIDTPKEDSYIVVLNVDMFTMANLRKLNASSNVNGVLLVQKEQRSQINKFSPESKCPNKYSGLADAAHNYSSDVCPAGSPWNRFGSEIAMQFWNIPIFFTDDRPTIREIEQWFEKYNLPLSNQADRPLSALELSSYMFASGDSNKCIRRSSSRYDFNPLRLCDPLGDENIYSPVIPFTEFNKTKNESYIFVTARLDSTSLFFGRAVGALSTATSLVALLLTSKLLTRLVVDNKSSAKKNVLFLLFNGEAYDYIGSQRVVYDMLHGDFPFKEAPLQLDDIGLFIELSQLRQDDGDRNLIYHTYKNLSRAQVPSILEFDSKFKTEASKFNFGNTLSEHNSGDDPVHPDRYPPSSYQSFLAHKAIPGFVLAKYRDDFHNKFYHSIFDDAQNLGYKFANGSKIPDDGLAAFIANFSTVLAHTLFSQMMEDESTKDLRITYEEADEVLRCFLETAGCEFFSRFEGSGLDGLPLDYFISVSRVASLTTSLARDSLAYLMGQNVSADNQNDCVNKAKNSPGYTYLWVQSESRCLESFVNSSLAVSPAFTIPEYELHEGIYSSWTESTWSSTGVRMFRKPSAKYEWLVCSIGSTVLVASFLILFWIRRNSRDLFNFPHLIATSSI